MDQSSGSDTGDRIRPSQTEAIAKGRFKSGVRRESMAERCRDKRPTSGNRPDRIDCA
jgi:hypothetical protein